MVVQDIAVEQKLRQFIKEFGDDRCSLELLTFLGKHPHTRFSRLAIIHALDAPRSDIDRALQHLINKGLIIIHDGNDIPVYTLSDSELLHRLALNLAGLNQCQWQLVLKQNM